MAVFSNFAIGVVIGWLWLLITRRQPASLGAGLLAATYLAAACLIAALQGCPIAPFITGAVVGVLGHVLWLRRCAERPEQTR